MKQLMDERIHACEFHPTDCAQYGVLVAAPAAPAEPVAPGAPIVRIARVAHVAPAALVAPPRMRGQAPYWWDPSLHIRARSRSRARGACHPAWSAIAGAGWGRDAPTSAAAAAAREGRSPTRTPPADG